MGEWAYVANYPAAGTMRIPVRAGGTIYVLTSNGANTSLLHKWNGTTWEALASPPALVWTGDALAYTRETFVAAAGYAINGGADLIFLGYLECRTAAQTTYGTDYGLSTQAYVRVYNIAGNTWTDFSGTHTHPGTAGWDQRSLEGPAFCSAGWDPVAAKFVVAYGPGVSWAFTYLYRICYAFDPATLQYGTPTTAPMSMAQVKGGFAVTPDGDQWFLSYKPLGSRGWLSHLNSTALRCGTIDITVRKDLPYWTPQRVYKLGADGAWAVDSAVLKTQVGPWEWSVENALSQCYHDCIGVPPIFARQMYDAAEKLFYYRVWKKTPEGEVDFPSAPPCPQEDGAVPYLFGDADGYLFGDSVRLYQWVTTGGGGATTCTITSPAAAATVSGLVQVTGTATDDTELAKVRLYIDGVYMAEDALAGMSANWTLSVNTSLLSNGSHTLQAIASDADGNTGSSDTVTVTVDNTVLPSDTTPPTVTITTPGQAGLSFVDTVSVAALCTDNQSLAEARFYIDDVLQSAATQALTGQSDVASATLDISEWSNGTHTVTVRVLDASGNVGQASITIVVNNLLAEQPKVLYTAEVPVVAYPWRISDHTPRAHKLDVIPSVVPADPRKVYNVYPFVKHRTSSGGAIAADYTTYDAITTWQVHPLASDAAALRYALVAKPAFAASYWEVADADEFVRILTCGDRTVALAANPFRIYELDGANLNLLYAFTGSVTFTTLYEAAYADSKLLLATDIGLVAYDFDSEDLPVVIRLSSSSPSTGSVAVLNDTPLVPQGGALYSYTWPSATLLASQSPDGAMCAYKHGTADYLFKATSGATPSVYAFAASGGASYGGKWNSIYSLTKAVSRIINTPDGQAWLCCDKQVHRSSPTWTLDGEFSSGLVRAVTYWRGRFWAAGTIGGLWWRTTNGWAQFNALTGYQVQDLQVVDGALYVAGSYTADSLTRARIMRLYINEGGDFQSGPTPPDLIGRVVDYADITAQ